MTRPGCWVPVPGVPFSARLERAELGTVTGQQGQREEGHGDEDDNGERQRRGAEPAAALARAGAF